MTDLHVVRLEQKDRRLGRQIVHDPASKARSFLPRATVDRSTWRTRTIRTWDPTPNPDQCHGECTFCAQCMLFNSVGNRRLGIVLDMRIAHQGYALATTLDPFEGTFTYNTATKVTGGDDTGSSGLAACKASQALKLGGPYQFLFGGADEVVQTLMTGRNPDGTLGRAVAIGSRWSFSMFYPNADLRIEPSEGNAGGHEYVARGYDAQRDWVLIRCWWGDGFRDVWIKREHLNELILDDGDAHIQDRLL